MPSTDPVDFSNRSANRGVKANKLIVGNGSNPVEIGYVEVDITVAEMKALRAAPKTLVAAPGAGKVAVLESIVLIKDGANGYTETADNLQVKYTNGSGAAASEAIESTGFVDTAGDDMIVGRRANDCAPVANAALVLHNTGDGELGGTGDPVRAKVTYTVHVTGL